MKVKNLKLLATSDEDLRVIAAHLQDAIVSTKETANLKKNRIFLIELNRFMWEDVEKGVFRKNKRIRTIVKFDNVINVVSKNINLREEKNFLDFLTIESSLLLDKSYEIKLIFSGNGIIKIKAEVIDVTLDDQGASWESKMQPKHNFL
jgi:phosphopantothenoylcysteine synthetase/decarboxylase